jgi:hypothetical protein
MHDTGVHWILRVGVAACFIGHGAFGVITKAAWVPYFGIWGVPEPWAWRLMPLVGGVDISIGILTLIQPVRAVILYMAFWGLQTAALRPLAGQGVWEFLERAGNYGVPLAFLLLLGPGQSLRDWASSRPAPRLTHERAAAIEWTLRVTTASLLIGHGAFDFAMHKDWSGYAAALGISPATVAAHPLRAFGGWAEVALGLVVLAFPAAPVLVFVFVWKLSTEALRPLAGEPIWEFVERGGSYAAPLALLMLRRSCTAARAGGLPLRISSLRADQQPNHERSLSESNAVGEERPKLDAGPPAEAFECFQIVDTDSVPIQCDGTHRGEPRGFSTRGLVLWTIVRVCSTRAQIDWRRPTARGV